jgi:3-hydroxyacyl-[acyl-carrier-protein] dehydratase
LNSHDIHEVLKYLPHRYPFLLIDRVVSYTKDISLSAIKNITINEPFFQGHFPYHPVMPGVLILEAMAQACAILSIKSLDTSPNENSVYYLAGIDKARFKRPVSPGDQLLIKVEIKRIMKGIWVYECKSLVADELCCSAELMCTYKGV